MGIEILRAQAAVDQRAAGAAGAAGLLDAGRQTEARARLQEALQEVEARARLLWCKWKLQPPDLPHLKPGQALVLSGGYTVISPFPLRQN